MSGYIGNIPVPSATQSFETFTATGGQTSFGTAGYTPGYLQVYLNGVLLDNGSDYTASNGSDVVLAVGAISGDILTVISFSTFEVSNQAFTGDFSVDSPTFVVDSTNNRVGIGTASPSRQLHINDTNAGLLITGAVNTSGALLSIREDTQDIQLVNNSTGGIRFTANSSERMRIDSSGNVGIGNTIPSSFNSQARNLVIGDGVNRQGITIYSGATEQANIFFADGTTGSDPVRGGINYNHSNDSLSLRVNDSNRLTITSTGVGLFGMTAADGPTGATDINGTEIGRGYLNFNRDDTADIRFIGFNLNGSTVASIGIRSGDLFLQGTDTTTAGIKMSDGAVRPCNSDGSNSDNDTDLGTSGTRFKDLYLSGGVYVGGTGSANYLDDYETGTFTPTITFGGASVGVTYVNQEGYYIKVGKLVYVTMFLRLSNKGSSTGDAYIHGLPFTVGNGLPSTGIEGFGVFTYFEQMAANISGLVLSGENSSTTAAIRYLPTSGTISPNATDSLFSNNFNSRMALTYNSV